jgi:hypothetical protein
MTEHASQSLPVSEPEVKATFCAVCGVGCTPLLGPCRGVECSATALAVITPVCITYLFQGAVPFPYFLARLMKVVPCTGTASSSRVPLLPVTHLTPPLISPPCPHIRC